MITLGCDKGIAVVYLFGLEMIDFYVYLVDYLKKRFKWDSYLLD